jgi:hypothetical protein
MLARLQTVFLLLALLATPPDLVTRVSALSKDDCHGICCPSRAGHVAPEQNHARSSGHGAKICPNGLAGHYAICLVKSKQKIVYEIVAPLRPAVLSAPPCIAGAQLSAQALPARAKFMFPGFLPAPFQPPRS